MCRKGCLVFILLIATFRPSFASSSHMGCFKEHLVDAIKINRIKKQKYAKLSQNQSLKISKKLIRNEFLLLPVAKIIDSLAKKYQRQGINVVCDDFVSMDVISEEVSLKRPLDYTYFKIPHKKWKSSLNRLYRKGELSVLKERLHSYIKKLNEKPEINCMYKHILESAYLITSNAIKFDALAKEKQTRSPMCLSRFMLKAHLMSLGFAKRLDTRAYPLQKKGIGIICDDVPQIVFE